MKKMSFFEHRGYWQYLATGLFGGGFWRFYRKIQGFLRPTVWIRRIFRLLSLFVLLVESGVIFLVLSALSLLFLPAGAILLILLLPSFLREREMARRRLLPSLTGRRVVMTKGEGKGLASALFMDGYFVLSVRQNRGWHLSVLGDGRAEISPRLYFALRREIVRRSARLFVIENFGDTLAKRARDMV